MGVYRDKEDEFITVLFLKRMFSNRKHPFYGAKNFLE
jgi:hypothetical protein